MKTLVFISVLLAGITVLGQTTYAQGIPNPVQAGAYGGMGWYIPHNYSGYYNDYRYYNWRSRYRYDYRWNYYRRYPIFEDWDVALANRFREIEMEMNWQHNWKRNR